MCNIFHESLEDKCHRFLNAVEPGTVVPIHRHPTKDESFVILRGKVRVTTHNDDGSIIEDVGVREERGNFGGAFLRRCGISWRRWRQGVY